LELVPDKFVKLGFSGIKSYKDVVKYKNAGAKAVLIGTRLMKEKNIELFIKNIKSI